MAIFDFQKGCFFDFRENYFLVSVYTGEITPFTDKELDTPAKRVHRTIDDLVKKFFDKQSTTAQEASRLSSQKVAAFHALAEACASSISGEQELDHLCDKTQQCAISSAAVGAAAAAGGSLGSFLHATGEWIRSTLVAPFASTSAPTLSMLRSVSDSLRSMKALAATREAQLEQILKSQNENREAACEKVLAILRQLSHRELAGFLLKKTKNIYTQAFNLLIRFHDTIRQKELSELTEVDRDISFFIARMRDKIFHVRLASCYDPKLDDVVNLRRQILQMNEDPEINEFLKENELELLKEYPEFKSKLFAGQDAFVNKVLEKAKFDVNQIEMPLREYILASGHSIKSIIIDNSSCTIKFTTDKLREVLRFFPNLTELRLVSFDLQENAFIEIAKCTQLKTLYVRAPYNSQIPVDAIRPLHEAVQARIARGQQRDNPIESLYFEGYTGITDTALQLLAQFRNLHDLSLINCTISDAGIAHLQSLTFRSLLIRGSGYPDIRDGRPPRFYTTITDEGLGGLLRSQLEKQEEQKRQVNPIMLEKFGFHFRPGITTEKSLQYLESFSNLSELQIDVPADCADHYYTHTINTKTWYDRPTIVTAECIDKFLNAIPPKLLKNIGESLCNTIITSHPTRDQIASIENRTLREFIQQHGYQVQTLSLNGLIRPGLRIDSPAIDAIADYFPNLQTLDLSYTIITKEGARALQRCRKLQDLNLLECQIGDEEVAELQGCTALTTLTLDEANVGALSRNEREFAPRITGSTFDTLPASLQVLSCAGSALTDGGVAKLRHLKKLRELDIAYAYHVTGSTFSELSPTIEVLNCSHCRLTDKAIENLAHLQKLTHLYLSSNGGLTDRAVAALKVFQQLVDLSLSRCFSITDKEFDKLPPLLQRLSCVNCHKIAEKAFETLVRLRHLKDVDFTYAMVRRSPKYEAFERQLRSRGILHSVR